VLSHSKVLIGVGFDDEASLVTSEISRSDGAQFFGGAHRGRVCVRVFIGVSVRACVVLCNCQKKYIGVFLYKIYITH
jgi:hypothetical protein